MIAGNGLSGGGNLGADRTITLGTPGNITNATTNSVTTTSHTHALGFTAAEVYTGSSSTNTSFPIGHPIAMYIAGGGVAHNASVSPCLSTAENYYYRRVGDSNDGAALTGTWRTRGAIDTGRHLAQRTA